MGRTNLCVSYWTIGLQRNGGLAEYCSVPASACLNASSSRMTADACALVQPMAVAVHAMRRGNPLAGMQVLVIGVGGIGAFLAYALADLGVKVTVADVREDRLTSAVGLAGIQGIRYTGDQASVVERLNDLSSLPDIVYEVSGSQDGIELASKAVERGGRIVAVGLQSRPRSWDLRELTLREVELVGSNAHVMRVDVPESLRLLSLETGRWKHIAPIALPLEQTVEEGLVPLARGGASSIKTLVDPWILSIRETVF